MRATCAKPASPLAENAFSPNQSGKLGLYHKSPAPTPAKSNIVFSSLRCGKLSARDCAPALIQSSSAAAEGFSSGNPRRIRRIPSLEPSLRRLLTRPFAHNKQTVANLCRCNHSLTFALRM